MNNHSAVNAYLVSLRARISPEAAGIGVPIGERRVQGLRREEVAQLAGISESYYTRIERGDLSGVSESVLNSIAHALKLEPAERNYLINLAKESSSIKKVAEAKINMDMISGLIDALGDFPAMVSDRYGDVLASTRGARLLFPGLYPDGQEPLNFGRHLYLTPSSKDFFPDWECVARDGAEFYRFLTSRFPDDLKLRKLMSEFIEGSPEFRDWWGSQKVRTLDYGMKTLNHPIVGIMEVTYEMLHLSPLECGVFMTAYHVESGSKSAAKMAKLVS